MANKTRLLALADALEKGLPGVIFDLAQWRTSGESCNTIACIAGHASILAEQDPEFPKYELSSWTRGVAMSYLELSDMQAQMLFLPAHGPMGHLPPQRDYIDITAHEAAEVVRHFAETGKVFWGIIPDFPTT